jgi:hypothetical protein
MALARLIPGSREQEKKGAAIRKKNNRKDICLVKTVNTSS